MACIIKPLVTEEMTKTTDKSSIRKTYKVKDKGHTRVVELRYGFIVRPEANKLQIKKGIESPYNVIVINVNTACCAGEYSSRYTRVGLVRGQKAAFEKTIVALKGSGTIDFYGNI